MKRFATLTLITCLYTMIDVALGHGYMKSPRSRNFKAYEDGVWWGGTNNDPKPESCPHCLNLGGSLARCGLTGERNYDHPMNFNGGPLQWTTESTYAVGSIIDIDTVITAHHKGHIEVKACPMTNQGDVPSQSCFDSHPLEFVSDELYGAPKDANYPGRAYLAPPGMTQSDNSGVSGMLYKFKFKLPSDVSGHVLLQWYYITGNSCTAAGYNNYSFPAGWESSAPVCDRIPDDGVGVPEQFWNCGEVYVGASGPTSTPAPTPGSTPAPTPGSTPAPTPGPTPSPVLETTNSPTRAPSVSNNDSICPTGYTGLVPSETCSSFQHCVSGETVGGFIPCPDGLLFDEALQVCNWDYAVSCSICPTGYTGLVPSETCSSFQHCVSGETVGGFLPCPPGLLFDEALQVCNYAYSVSCNGSPPDGGPGPQCPAGYSGVIAVDNCTGFRHCSNGVLISAKQSCSAGLLFDESTQSCNWSSAVTCGESRKKRRLRGA